MLADSVLGCAHKVSAGRNRRTLREKAFNRRERRERAAENAKKIFTRSSLRSLFFAWFFASFAVKDF
jgi:hypothetical protein